MFVFIYTHFHMQIHFYTHIFIIIIISLGKRECPSCLKHFHRWKLRPVLAAVDISTNSLWIWYCFMRHICIKRCKFVQMTNWNIFKWALLLPAPQHFFRSFSCLRLLYVDFGVMNFCSNSGPNALCIWPLLFPHIAKKERFCSYH